MIAAENDTLEEGRMALILLEQQLTEGRDYIRSDASVGSGSRQNSQNRKLLDKVPRDARLHNRKGSPLGLTIEELDDRGLLDGGGSTKSSTSKQKNRRSLEMRNRLSRLHDRDQEVSGKIINGLFHMLRIFARRGIMLESYCRDKDIDNRGLIHRSKFMEILKKLSLPFSRKELSDVIDRYQIPSSNEVDYETLFRDAGVQDIHHDGEGDYSQSIENPAIVLNEVKRMLLELVRNFGKSFDDIYAMFSCWDNEGVGTVTATQFLRVLNRLHIELEDNDQDFLVELLDFDSMGRIDFGRLLAYCFGDTSSNYRPLNEDHGELSSGISVDTPGKLSSDLLGSSSNRRPQTASLLISTSNGPALAEPSVPSGTRQDPAGVRNRPTTASARVSLNHNSTRHAANYQSDRVSGDDRHLILDFPDDDIIDDDGHQLSLTPNTQDHIANARPNPIYSVGGRSKLAQWDLPGEGHDIGSLNDTTLVTDQDDSNFGSPVRQHLSNGKSLAAAENLGLSRLELADPGRLPKLSGALRDEKQAAHALFSLHLIDESLRNEYISQIRPNHSNWHRPVEKTKMSTDHKRFDSHYETIHSSSVRVSQVLTKLRERLLFQHKNGLSLHELYIQFSTRERNFFNYVDICRVLPLLNIESFDEELAQGIVAGIGIDGVEIVSFGEFKVFLLDPDHKELEFSVQHQIGQQLERLGREYQAMFNNIFWDNELLYLRGAGSANEERNLYRQLLQSGFVGNSVFRDTLPQLGVKLSPTDISRWICRFDINDDGRCSVVRFLYCIQSSNSWRNAERVLAIQEEAIEEGRLVRDKQRVGEYQDMSEELISMAEFLGIRPITDGHLLWIAVDALRAPLPINWSAQKDGQGRIYFYNHISNQSRWDHPLDSHFRMLRDEYRHSEQQPIPFNHPNAEIFGGHTSEHRSSPQWRSDDANRLRPQSAAVGSIPSFRRHDQVSIPAASALNFRPSSAPNHPNDKHVDRRGVPTKYDHNAKAAPSIEDIYSRNQLKKVGKGSIAASSANPAGNSTGLRPANKVPSAVDRAIGHAALTQKVPQVLDQSVRPRDRVSHDYSVVPPTRREMNQMAHLVEMFDDSLIDKLDCIIVPKQSDVPLKGKMPTDTGKKGRGGIVLL